MEILNPGLRPGVPPVAAMMNGAAAMRSGETRNKNYCDGWGYPTIDAFFHGKSQNFEWMTRGTPMTSWKPPYGKMSENMVKKMSQVLDYI